MHRAPPTARTALWDWGTRYLKADYSSEQIEGTLALVHSDTPSLQVSHETIYGFAASFVAGCQKASHLFFPDGFDLSPCHAGILVLRH